MPHSMHLNSLRAFRVAALLGLLGVGLGAFGAHGLESTFAATPKTREWWDKAVFYHLVHSSVMLGLAFARTLATAAWVLLGSGVLLFSGSLYALVLGGPHWLVHVTPFGGLCLLAGWLWLVIRPPALGNGGPA